MLDVGQSDDDDPYSTYSAVLLLCPVIVCLFSEYSVIVFPVPVLPGVIQLLFAKEAYNVRSLRPNTVEGTSSRVCACQQRR